jgi:hypothetical protein
MKHKLLSALGLIVLVMVTLGMSPAEAATAAGPYYAIPSWDQTLACATLATCPRFIVLSNMSGAAVLDRETGLVWEQSPSTTFFIWSTAHVHCNDLNLGNRKGWRMPTIQELASLMDMTPRSPSALPAGHPFSNVQSNFYWSATTNSDDAGSVWDAFFSPGIVSATSKSEPGGLVWCVRGGQGVNPQ